MKKGLCIGIVFGVISLIVISNVIAYQSTITVKTGFPNQDIIFKAGDPDNGATLPGGEFRSKSDSYGEVVFDYNLEPIRIKMSFMAWNGNSYSTFLNGKEAIFIPNVILDELVDVNLNQINASVNAYSNKTKEEPKTEVKNETANNSGIDVQVKVSNNTLIENETTSVESTIQEKTGIGKLTGFAINNGKEVLTSLVTYYILGGLLILIGGFIFIKKKGIKKADNFIVTKLSDIKKNRNESVKEDSAIAKAEKKLEEAKKEIEDIKNKKSKIAEAKKRLEDAKRELDELGDY